MTDKINQGGIERPCRYVLNNLKGERRGIIVGVGPTHYIVRDSEELTQHQILKQNVKEVELWGPDDMPKAYFERLGIRAWGN